MTSSTSCLLHLSVIPRASKRSSPPTVHLCHQPRKLPDWPSLHRPRLCPGRRRHCPLGHRHDIILPIPRRHYDHCHPSDAVLVFHTHVPPVFRCWMPCPNIFGACDAQWCIIKTPHDHPRHSLGCRRHGTHEIKIIQSSSPSGSACESAASVVPEPRGGLCRPPKMITTACGTHCHFQKSRAGSAHARRGENDHTALPSRCHSPPLLPWLNLG